MFLLFLFAVSPVLPLLNPLSDIWVRQLDHKINGRNKRSLQKCSMMNSIFQLICVLPNYTKELKKVAKTMKGSLYQN